MEEDGYEIFHTAHMSVTERLIACLKNETMTDVALVGDDGIPVPACRYILGSASSVFQPLLYGNFKAESDSSTVTIQGANQKSLTALVEFCCSDELNTSIWADSHPLEIVHDTVSLAKLAHTYEIPNLQSKVKEFLNPLMIAYPPLACSVFNLADSVATPDIHIASLVIIQEQAYTALSSTRKDGSKTAVGGMTCLSPEKLEEIMADNEVEADELFLFRELVLWRDHNASKYKHINSICKSVVRHLDLSSIDPNEIETTVMNSGFVDASMLVKALMAQAKSATNEGLAFASLQGPRGRKYAHVLVEGAGEEDCNGVYVHVKKDKMSTSGVTGGNLSTSKNLLYFIKRPDGAGNSGASVIKGGHQNSSMTTSKRTFVLVQDSNGIWRICDSYKNILYEWDQSTKEETRNDKTSFPHKGWTSVSGELPPPECSWLRPHTTTQKGGGNAAQSQIGPSTQVAPGVPSVEATQVGLNNRERLCKNEGMRPTESQKNLHEIAQPTLGTHGKVADIDKIHGNSQGLVVVGNEKTKLAAVNSIPLTKQPPAPLEVFDGSSNRKFVTTEAGTKKEKRKNARMSSLIDDATDHVATVAVDINTPNNDPILGTMIGGDGFVTDDNKNNNISAKKKYFNELPVGKGPVSQAFNNKGSSSSSINDHMSSTIRLSCILPASNGEPALISCTPRVGL